RPHLDRAGRRKLRDRRPASPDLADELVAARRDRPDTRLVSVDAHRPHQHGVGRTATCMRWWRGEGDGDQSHQPPGGRAPHRRLSTLAGIAVSRKKGPLDHGRGTSRRRSFRPRRITHDTRPDSGNSGPHTTPSNETISRRSTPSTPPAPCSWRFASHATCLPSGVNRGGHMAPYLRVTGLPST